MRDHIRILGWLYVACGAMMLVFGVVFGGIFGAAGLGLMAWRGAVFGGVGAFIALCMAVVSLPSIVEGWALLTGKPWSRILGIVLSVMNLASFPIGTLIGAYGLWVLLNDETRRLLDAGDPRLRRGS